MLNSHFEYQERTGFMPYRLG